MNAFEYAMPTSLDEAVAQLSPTAGETQVLAGGTDLVTALKQGIVAPKRIVSIRHIEDIKGIDVSGGSLRIGAMTSLDELSTHDEIKKSCPSLVRAVHAIGSKQIACMGTVGGDLCQLPRDWYFRNGFGLIARDGNRDLVAEGDNRYHAIFGNDGPAKFVNASRLAPSLIALGATVTVRGPGGKTRDLPIADLFHSPKSSDEGNTTLAPNEIVTHVNVPIGPGKNASYDIQPRQGLDWPLVAAAVAFEEAGGSARNVRVVLGHVAPTPWVASEAAKALEGKAVNEASAAAAGEAAASGANPLSRNGYKTKLVKVAVKRAILTAAKA